MGNSVKIKRKKIKINVFDIILFLCLTLYTLFVLMLLFWAFTTSLKVSDYTIFDNIIGLPEGHIWEWQWSNWITAFSKFRIFRTINDERVLLSFFDLFVNTVLYAVINAFLHAIIPCTMAYVCVKYPCFLSRVIYGIVLVTMMLPIVGAYPSTIRILNALGLYNTWLGNWIQNFNFTGLYFLIFFGLVRGLNKELWEAAEIDGAGQYSIYLKIILPIMINTVGLVFMLNFITFWNEYQVNMLYLPSHPTLAVAVYEVGISGDDAFTSYFPGKMSLYIVFVVPIFILFMIFKDKIMGNIAIGGVKE